MNKNMKFATTLTAFLFAIVSAAAARAGAPDNTQLFVINNAVGKNQISFLSSAPLEDIKGTASEVSGSFTFDPANPAAAKGKVRVAVESMKTGIKKRDKHMLSEDWLNAAKYPYIEFSIQRIDNIKKVQEEEYKGLTIYQGLALGTFSLHGTTQEMQVPVKIRVMRESEKTRERAPGDFAVVQCTFTVALADYNVSGARGMVGSKVGEEIAIEATLYSSNGLQN